MQLRRLRVALVGLPAFFAEAANEPLGLQNPKRRSQQERLDSHVGQSIDGRERIVRVNGREDEVAGERGAKADAGRFRVADFAHHDDVRILPQKRPEGSGEGQTDLRLHLDLIDSLELVLDGVFDRADVRVGFVQLVQAGVQRGALAAAGRAGHKHQTVRHLDRFDQVLRLPFVESQAGKFDGNGSLVEDSHDHLLAVDGGHGADAEIDALYAGFHGDGAVLRDALFGNIHLGQNLEAGDDGHELRFRRRRQCAQLAIHPQANRAGILERLQVNIAGPRPQGLVENLVHHADDAAVGPLWRRRIKLQDIVVVVNLPPPLPPPLLLPPPCRTRQGG